MNPVASLFSIALLAPAALAQACFEYDLGTSLGSANDTVHAAQPIGFAFPMNDGIIVSSYTDIHISDRGVCWLSNAGVPAPPGAFVSQGVQLSELTQYAPCIAAFWTDANCGYTVWPQGEVFINNSDPSKCVITWAGMWTYPNAGPTYTFQLTLFPSGRIQIVWDADTNNYGSPFIQNAIVGATLGGGAALPAAVDLSSAPVSVNGTTIFEEFVQAGTFDLADSGVVLDPTWFGWSATPLTNCALSVPFGAGCMDEPGDYYELLPPGQFDLAGAAIELQRRSNGYVSGASASAAIVPPSAAAVDVALGDDVLETFALSQPMPGPGGPVTHLTVCSNGRIAFGALGNGIAFQPTEIAWVNSTEAEIAVCWHDFQPDAPGSGTIKREEVNGVLYVTWDDVYSWGYAVGDTFQAQFDLNTGDITLVYDASWSNTGNDYLIGARGLGPIQGKHPRDLSVALGSAIEHFDVERLPLTLEAPGPRLGSNWELNIIHIDPMYLGGLTLFSTAPGPGLPLSAIGLNAPGCSIWLGGTALGTLAVPQGYVKTIVPVPNYSPLLGAVLCAQTAYLTQANPANLLLTNGIEGRLGF